MQSSPGSLSLDRLDAYLHDLRTWVVAKCRTAIAVAVEAKRLGPMPRLVLEALLENECGSARTDIAHARAIESDATERLTRWRELAPHRVLGRELGLSAPSITVLVMAAAPALWSDLGHVYRMIARAKGAAVVDEHLIGELLGGHAATHAVVARELDPGSALVRSGACTLGRGPRPDAAVVVDPSVLRRLAGASAVSATCG